MRTQPPTPHLKIMLKVPNKRIVMCVRSGCWIVQLSIYTGQENEQLQAEPQTGSRDKKKVKIKREHERSAKELREIRHVSDQA